MITQNQPVSSPPTTARPKAAPPTSKRVWAETLFAFVTVTTLVSMLYRLRGIGFIERNLAVVAAVLFLYLPAFLLWRQGHELDQYGLRLKPLGRGLVFYGLAVVIVVPSFTLGYALYVRRVCPWFSMQLVHAFGKAYALGKWRLLCPPALTPVLRLAPDLFLSALSQLLVVALPEEFFFRGFVLGRLREVMRAPTALLLTSALFALGHFLVTFAPASLAVFFPGLLFGLLRLGTGSVLAGTLFHATCNLLIDTLHRSFG